MMMIYCRFKTQWDITSSHRIRSGNDMQYAFSYYYFLMDSKRNNTAVDFIHEMDIDNSLYVYFKIILLWVSMHYLTVFTLAQMFYVILECTVCMMLCRVDVFFCS